MEWNDTPLTRKEVFEATQTILLMKIQQKEKELYALNEAYGKVQIELFKMEEENADGTHRS